jgi:hypothetical protein
MSDVLAARFPEIVYLLSAYVLGDSTLPEEMNEYAVTEATGRAPRVLGDLNELLSDATVTDEQLDAFVRTLSMRWYGSGRATLEHVGEALMRVMETRAGLRPPRHVLDRLAAWLRKQDMIPPGDLTDWTVVDAGEDRWVLTPPGLAGVILVVTPSTIGFIRPAFESVPDALRKLGIS